MRTEHTGFACPSCGTPLDATGEETACPTCGERYTLLCRQACPGCGLSLEGKQPTTHCPDCDEELPAPTKAWQFADEAGYCPACGRRLARYKGGLRQCSHCGYSSRFNGSTGQWEGTLRPFLCLCGRRISPTAVKGSCPDCGRAFMLNPKGGQWEEQVTYEQFTCPCCGHRQELDSRDNEAACPQCNLRFTQRTRQNCPACGMTFEGLAGSLDCPDCGARLNPARLDWTCSTPPGKCPLCGAAMTRSADGRRCDCPRCRYAHCYDSARRAWTQLYRKIRCSCGKSFVVKRSRPRCPHCKKSYRLNKRKGKWEKAGIGTTLGLPSIGKPGQPRRSPLTTPGTRLPTRQPSGCFNSIDNLLTILFTILAAVYLILQAFILLLGACGQL